MATTGELDYSGTAGLNTDIGGVSVAENIPPSNLNDAIRNMAAFRHDAITRHVTKTVGTYTAVKADHDQFWRCTGAVTLNLTAAATLTDGWCLWVRANGGTVTIDPAGSESIDESATSMTLPDGSMTLIICTGTAFYTVNSGFNGYSDWVAYTPTFSGLGTVTDISVWSKRIGDSLYVKGMFTTGTTTASEVRVTLGFNGTNANVTSHATKIASAAEIAGIAGTNVFSSTFFGFVTLIERSKGYLTFGEQASGVGALSKIDGTNIGNGEQMSFHAVVPIAGW